MEMLKVYAKCIEKMEDVGLEVEEITDAARATALVNASDKTYITPHVWPAFNDLTSKTYFWLFLKDKEAGTIEGVIASRVDDIGGGEFTKFWSNHYKRLAGTDFGGIIDTKRETPADKHFYGQCVYIGDLFCNPKKRVDLEAFMGIAHTVAMIKWPDAKLHYAYISEKDARRGQSHRLIWNRTVSGFHKWHEKPLKRNDSDVLVWIDRSDISYELRNRFLSTDTAAKGQNKVVPLGAL